MGFVTDPEITGLHFNNELIMNVFIKTIEAEIKTYFNVILASLITWV